MTAAWILAGVLGAAAYGVDRLALSVLKPFPGAPDRTVPDTGVAHEALTIVSGDHRLSAWLLRPAGEPREPLVMVAHGWGANYSRLLRLAEPLVADGYEVLLFDVRGHGDNEPVPFITVRHFRDDIMAVAAWARGRFPDRRIALVGHSLGGSAAILAVAEGARVDALVTIASPSDVVRITAEYLSEQGLPGPLMARLCIPFWWRRAGSRFGPLTPTRRLPEVAVPLLILQPENDRRVPRGHAERLAKAAGQPFVEISGAGHSDVVGDPETHRVVREFLEEL